MSKSTLERLTAADPALAVTDDELARSRAKSLAVMGVDAEQLTVGGSVEDFHRQPARRPMPLLARYGLVAAAAAAVIAGAFVASSTPTEVLLEQAAPAATEPGTGSSEIPPLPEITGVRMSTFDNHIVTGGNGNKAAVSNDPEADFHMDALNMGKLGLNSGGCFVNDAAAGGSGGLIFPAGTSVTETGVVFPDGASLNIGDDFAFGGGLSGDLTPSECLSTGVGFLVQSWDPIP
ncbi:hypothetical protein [Paenarthrobacter aurescens]|uniref:hypothetical protein n=1 Tax=Paenarthrobacter aurescens TaxID=43663 RepID=UPI0021BEA10A|nr:hypothetical protein [Paenarthrobacter aurescens]MCT9869700.1 hypothetical protein [Paenarthrobacter aurescens]